VLNLGDPCLCDTHQGSDLRLGKPGVLPQLRELIAALLGAHLRPAPHHGHDVVVRIIHAVLLTRLHDKSFAPA
jgi:hypothetical protein